MTQHTRNIIAYILLGVSTLLVVVFVVQHFTAPRHMLWHRDLAWVALAAVSAAEIVRGRRRRKGMQTPS